MKRLFHRKDKTSNQAQATYNDLQPYQQPGGTQTTASSGVTTATTDPPHSNSLAPPVPLASQPHGSGAAGGPVIPRPPRVSEVGNAIGWTCGVGFDFAYILSLADHLVASKDASKEAAKALSKEFKHAAPPAQERAVRLTGILFRNTDARFRHQVAQKKFLAALTGLVSSPTTPTPVKLMVFRILSPLAYESRHSSDLSPITQAYDSLLSDPRTRPSPDLLGAEAYDPALFPPHGAPLEPEDPLLRPEAILSGQGRGGPSGRARRPRNERFPTGLEQMQDLRTRATEGRHYASMLADAVVHAEEDEEKERKRRSGMQPEEWAKELQKVGSAGAHHEGAAAPGPGQEIEVRSGLEANEVIQEIHAKLLETQDFLTSNLDWAAAQATQSRARADAETPARPAVTAPTPAPALSPAEAEAAVNVRLASNNPFAAVLSGDAPIPETTPTTTTNGKQTTEEEDILSEVLSATTEISDALASYSNRLAESRERATEESELATAMARSVAETHVDRYVLEQESRYRSDTIRTHDYVEGVSGEHVPAQQFGAGAMGQGRDRNVETRPTVTTYDSHAAFFGGQQPDTQQIASNSASSPYDGLEALAGLTFDSPTTHDPHNTGNTSDPFGDLTNSGTPTAEPAPSAVPQFASTNPYASYTSGGGASPARAYATEAYDSIAEHDYGSAASASPIRPTNSVLTEHGARERSTTDSSFRSSYIPAAPSAKALGKLRRVSVNQSMDEERAREQQEQLEAAMREKYRQNREAELQRREQQNGL